MNPKSIPKSRLDNLKGNHRDNTNAPFITNAVAIELILLKDFIAQAEATPNCDAIRIHFVRHPLTANQPHVLKIDNENLSQVSLAFVPANIIVRQPDWIAVDLEDQNNNILTLLICEPVGGARATDDRTGQCPPKPPGCT
jgi:hypothetical protein